MCEEEKKQLELINRNLVTLAMNQALLFSEMQAIKNNFNETHHFQESEKTFKLSNIMTKAIKPQRHSQTA